MPILASLIAAFLAAAPAEPLASCLSTVLPGTMRPERLDDHVRTLVDQFVLVSPLVHGPRTRNEIYALEPGRAEAVRDRMIERGVPSGSIRVIGRDEGRERFGRQPSSTLFLIAESPGQSCTRELPRGAPSPRP